MSSPLSKKQLRERLQRLQSLLDQLLQAPPGIRGTFSQVYSRCGKSNCWCARQPQGHLHVRLTWSQNGKLHTRNLPSDLIQHATALTDQYRTARALRRRLHAALDDLARHADAFHIAAGDTARDAFLSSAQRKIVASRQQPRRKTPNSDMPHDT